MRIEFYANACFSIFHRDLHVLCDPWLVGSAVAGGWVPFPPPRTRIADIARPDIIFVSHVHSDHCSDDTMAQIARDVPIVSLGREPNFLRRRLQNLGFHNFKWIPEKTPTEILPGLTVETFGATFDHVCSQFIDSSIVFDFGDAVALNCNDNTPESEFCAYMRAHYPHVDVAFLPSGGGGAYPAMYDNLTLEERAATAESIRQNYMSVFTTAIDTIRPRMAVPVAGGYAVIGPLAAVVNWLQPRQLDLTKPRDYYAGAGKTDALVVPMQDGMILDVDAATVVKGEYRAWSDDELKSHFARLAAAPVSRSIVTKTPLGHLGKLIDVAREHLWTRQVPLDLFPDYRIHLDVAGASHLFALDLKTETVTRLQRGSPLVQPYLTMSLDQDSLLEWLLGVEDFNMLDSGHRIAYFRAPNVYVPEVYLLMSHFHI